MMGAFGAAVLALPVTVIATDRTEARAGVTSQDNFLTGDKPSTQAFDVENDPFLRAQTQAYHGSDTFGLNLYPRVVVPEIPKVQSIDGFAAGNVDVSLARPTWTFNASAYGNYDDTTIRSLFIQKPWDGTGLPPVPLAIPTTNAETRVKILSYSLTATFRDQVTRRFAEIVSGTYSEFGGFDNATIELLPRTYLYFVEDDLEYQTSRTDTFTTRFIANFNTFHTAADVDPIDTSRGGRVDEKWERKISNLSKFSLDGGAQVSDQASSGTRLSPVGEGVLTVNFHQRQAHAAAILVARVQPEINSLTGDVEQRFTGLSGLTYTLGLTTLRGQAEYLQAIPDKFVTTKYSFVGGEVALARGFGHSWVVDVGGRGGTQYLNATANHSSVQSLSGFVGLTYIWTGEKF